MDSIYGINIVTNNLMPEKVPVIKLSEDLQISQEFRNKINKSLLDNFGEKYLFYYFDNKLIMHPNVLDKVTKHCRETSEDYFHKTLKGEL